MQLGEGRGYVTLQRPSSRGEGGSPSRARTLVSCPECRRSPHSRRPAAAPRSTLLRGSRRFSPPLSPPKRPTSSSGLDPADDAAVYRLDDERAIVFTVDFFPPVVDDPRAFGAIAATNALNDVFAMGGAAPARALRSRRFRRSFRPRCWARSSPARTRPSARRERFSPAATRSATTSRSTASPWSASCIPTGIWPKSGARPGDALFLTKRLGTGLVLQAEREGRAPAGALEAALAAMLTLEPRGGRRRCGRSRPNAVTDVTGFGLLGHAHEMASRSGVRIELDAAALPALPSALELAEAGVRTGGDRRNREYAGPHVTSTAAGRPGSARIRPSDVRWAAVSLPADKRAVLEAHLRRRRAATSSAWARCTPGGVGSH